MPTLAEKKAVVEEITEQLEGSNAVYITKYTGMSVSDMGELRGKFREGNVQFKVYKNTLMKRAMDTIGGYDELYDHLEDQNGFAFVNEELAAPAKVLKDYIKEHNKPEFKAALIDGDFYSKDQLDTLAAMKSRTEVIGDIVGLLLAPISNVVSGLEAQGSNIAGAIQTIAEKGE
ncbi:50S ribosomal protein L10 [Rhodohalobacter barkolensis]|jgi:large subunit ribosomal protein L10|uniref:Large ribosomal subunit protein uL10 n=1 Tax=Rhodohalobacter barkolensis TaxID=2053187 RepID=A0A2N0VM79_9BACT|nr:50S ribosomal protein L10 [Rhodohalobacter barkolensis]PKD45306.1 50S ribosomal protein L10 [Rhodohalobacter barkolensis]